MYQAILALCLTLHAVRAGELPFDCVCPWVVTQGDVMLQNANDGFMDCETADVDDAAAGMLQSAIIPDVYKWPNGQIPYRLDEGGYNPNDVAFIHAKIAELSAMSSCINIYEKDFHGPETEYITVFNGNGCSSQIGRRGGSQKLSLHKSTFGHCLVNGIVWHEFMHAMGFYHEQSREDRDDHICIDWDNIHGGYHHNFYTASTDYLGTPYSYNSVMHYGRRAFAIDHSKPTIWTCDPAAMGVIGQRSALAQVDLDRINARYCP